MNRSFQPILFDAWETSSGAVELFPAVWEAAQNLAHPELSVRKEALDKLIEMGAPRLSPLVAYLIATRLLDPDIGVRQQVVKILGQLLLVDKEGRETDFIVRQYVVTYLTQMRTRNVYSILQVSDQSDELDGMVARILKSCPYAGEHLADIFNDRKISLSIRKKAVYFAGHVGFIDALPELERLEARLESRINGQQTMPFVSVGSPEEAELLPLIHQALELLNKP